jgi:hypothetical protein
MCDMTYKLNEDCSHIASDSSFKSLLDLLSSSNSPEELQDDVMGILGYDPASFDLVSELFAPGMREGVLRQGRGGASGLNVQAQAYVPSITALSGIVNGIRSQIATQAEGDALIQAQLDANANRPLFSGTNAIPEAVKYPHVYTSTVASSMTSLGGRLALPMGTIRREREVSRNMG